MIKIIEIKQCAHNKERVNLYTEDGFLMAVYIDTVLANHIKKDAVFSEEKLEEIRKQDAQRYAVQAAMEYVSYKPRTEKEVRVKLTLKEIAEDATDLAIEKLKEYGYINDAEYAAAYVAELLPKYGKRVILQKLAQKGVLRETALEATQTVAAPEEQLTKMAEMLRRRYRDDEPYKQKQKIIRSLMAKGFEYDDIKNALSKEEE
ncbi:MAG: RecX family transcriptional regulator [Christensenella sp.]|nr:RecX family transcriptional regulator [Christensenella sp.]